MATKILAAKTARIVGSLKQQAAFSIAAAGLATGTDYCDFFVENGGDGKPWHEKCPEDLTGIRMNAAKFSKDRMDRITKLGLRKTTSTDYCDFFVENGGDGNPWHEKCAAGRLKDLVSNPARRAMVLSRSNVLTTLQRVQRF